MRCTLFVLFIVGVSCSENKKSQSEENIQIYSDTIQGNENEKRINPKEVEGALRKEVDTLTENEFTSLFKEKERISYNLYKDSTLQANIDKIYYGWGHQKLLINDTLKTIDISGYPLNFKENNNQTKWLTTLTEGGSSIEIRLYTLDKYFNLVDNVIITSIAGDEGYKGWTLGEFKNDSTYSIKEFLTGFNTDSIESVHNYCLIIKSNGKIHRTENCR